MRVVLSVCRRTLWVPSLAPIAFVSAAAAWVAVRLAEEGLGGTEGFVEEVRSGCLLFAGLLVLSLAEPLEVGRDARAGLLLLRMARGGGTGLCARWLGLVLATLPVLLLTSLAAGGLPSAPASLLMELLVLAAAGLCLGAWFDRSRLVPALWCLAVAGYLRPWLLGSALGQPLAWILPQLGDLTGPWGLAHGLVWSAGALLLADGRAHAVVARAA